MRTSIFRYPQSQRAVALLAVGCTGGSLVIMSARAEATAAATQTATSVSCFQRPLGRANGVVARDVTATATGLVQARTSGTGDWDVAVFDVASGRVVAGSAGFDADELAEGFVRSGQRLHVQACSFAGGTAALAPQVSFLAVPAGTAEKVQVVEVDAASAAERARLQKLGLDLTEHGHGRALDVVTHGAKDVEALRKAGLRYTVRIADVAARAEADRAQDARYAAGHARSPLPSGRTTYRHLWDYNLEMKQLAQRYPTLVRRITLPHRSVQGRRVNGIEITAHAANVADGKPIFLNMGVHHAREWPSGEHALEFAHDLLTGYRGSDRTRRLVNTTRTIVVPVVNPDGFSISREAAQLGNFSALDYEMKRKNCSRGGAPAQYRTGSCAHNPAGRLRGTDLNRNYAGFWGGPGASPVWSDDTFRGVRPFSAPETQNIRDLISARQVTNLITNHTYSNLVLRPPSQVDTQLTGDEPLYAALGQRMANHNQYANQLAYGLYETTGATEDWSYYNTGGLGFTFETGTAGFHPPYSAGVVAEYRGLAPAAGNGKGGNRAAYFEMLEATASRALHATLTGAAPAGRTLRVHKEFVTPTSPVLGTDGTAGRPIRYRDVLSSTYRSDGGTFSWAVNPSTRPYVGARIGRDAVAPPQPDTMLSNPSGIPAENIGNPVTGPHEEYGFTVQGPPRADNGRMNVRIAWTNPSVDWDLYVVNAAGRTVGASTQGGTSFENAVLPDPPAGRYTIMIVNYDGGSTGDWRNGTITFSSPRPSTSGKKEAWTFSCEKTEGTVLSTRKVRVDRGKTARLGEVCR